MFHYFINGLYPYVLHSTKINMLLSYKINGYQLFHRYIHLLKQNNDILSLAHSWLLYIELFTDSLNKCEF